MEPPAKKPPKERGDTDESLRFERTKTDSELAAARAAIEKDADDVVQLARERAEELLGRARERSDKELTEKAASSAVRKEVAQERSAEDAATSEERATAHQQLSKERDEHEEALASLLRLEREDTDSKLLHERDRADHALFTRDEFLGMVSHDLRSLLGGIAMNASLVAKDATEQGESGAKTLRHADSIQRFTARMNRLIGDLLDIVSLEAGQLAVSPREDDAARLVRDAMETFQLSFAARGLTLTARVAPGTLLAKFDHERILQVLANLLSNALKFTPEGGQVTLSAAPLGPDVRFAVIDSGRGIPTADLEAVFERFRQVQTKDRRGLGLGLYIARCIVEAHGGKIWADRSDGGGTAVQFTLPGVSAK